MLEKNKNLIILGALAVIGFILYRRYRAKKAAEVAAAAQAAAVPQTVPVGVGLQ